ncbi:MAG: hypothetical protein BWY06_00214 [Candidatus Latescibacteria bacterium ADurb.Bin168]|nr:MAG: hypothetical protein BWY06_00214 [Candidatus Latescibacteria bacterium ADurb.Bin168]
MPDTLITIGITCYREGDLLREFRERVLAQTDDRWVAVPATPPKTPVPLLQTCPS